MNTSRPFMVEATRRRSSTVFSPMKTSSAKRGFNESSNGIMATSLLHGRA